MPLLYHGTSLPYAIAMAGTPALGTISVARGGGEFGGGFYTQKSSSNAARRAISIYGGGGAILAVAIDDAAYYSLRLRFLTLNMAQMLNAKLKGRARHTYRTTRDVMIGPLVHQPKIEQQKHQTPVAEALLNGPLTLRTVI